VDEADNVDESWSDVACLTFSCHVMSMKQERRELGRCARGSAMIWTSVATVALLGFFSLAVDVGRVRSVQSDLQNAADAASRAAVERLVAGRSTSDAIETAIATAGQNRADAASVTLNHSDVEVGVWDATTRQFTATNVGVNAVRVTATRSVARGNAVPLLFARVLGFGSQDVMRSSVSYTPRGSEYGLAAQRDMTFIQRGGISVTNSYNSLFGTYALQSPGVEGSVFANRDILASFYPDAAFPGTIGVRMEGRFVDDDGWWSFTMFGGNGSGSFGGTQGGYVAEFTDFPNPSAPTGSPVSPTTSLNYTGGGVHDLPGGLYVLDSINVTNGSQVRFNGPTQLFVRGNVTVNGGSINTVSQTPRDLSIQVDGGSTPNSTTVLFQNLTAPLHADVYAPRSRVRKVMLEGTRQFFGRMVGYDLTVEARGPVSLHSDVSLGKRVITVK
jgi:Flp pilus assembly protein TadG